MVTFLFTSIFIIGILAVALYFWQKPGKSAEESLPPLPPQRGLFSELKQTESGSHLLSSIDAEKQRSLLKEKAKATDRSALTEANALGDRAFYDEVLDILVAGADSDAALLALVSFVIRNDLPVNINLAEAVVDSWKQSPDRSSTAKTLHLAALADDAMLYQGTVETALQFWRNARLGNTSAEELNALFEGEFWVLSSRTRGSGAGFVLKRTLANARRELEGAARVRK